ncbi:hypothetical protein AF335_17505 [Streptomyces eurocidicus]|uniref:Uncharacterized protein n=1 Tax=Streptomyces eurocidicus TaxID=66423 RepID=A0A2N8NUF7_STREU|nr:hypothetical protein [Streptomyces eurocidicus]MBB5120259.1 hypothetical protein [Streptomyces eurocidicus]MBF6056061.1 hypothetical protein [Streptomyces eurocidicus]PNE32405.1 hypothetical protein AF335_17505 [Streptomyces eurocidicus]
MRTLMGAQNCGFGPASVLVAVSRLLSGHERVFVGDGIAAQFARRNATAFNGVHELTDPYGNGAALLDRLMENSDQAVSVMDADFVLHSVVARRPVVLVDCLFGFWQQHHRHSLARIRELCVTVPRTSFAAARHHLSGLSPHERVLAAHMLADHSVVQNFPGVSRRMAEFTEAGAEGVMHLTGPLVDLECLREAREGGPATGGPDYDLLINTGGFKNFLLDFEVNNDYLRLIDRWIPDLLADWPRFTRVLVCGGPYAGYRGGADQASGQRIDHRFLPQRELLPQVARTPHSFIAPGLSALNEATLLDQLPLGLHEQHYAHTFTIRNLADTLFGHQAARFADVLPGLALPEDDYAGTEALVGIAGRVLKDDDLYARFRSTFNERIEQYLFLTPEQRRGGVAELRRALDGPPAPSVIASILAAAG